MVIVQLQISEDRHLLDHDLIISKLMELFPGTKITQENTYDIRRESIKRIEEECKIQGKPFAAQTRMEEELALHEKRYGPSRNVMIPVNSGTMHFQGYVCVSRVWLSSEDLVDLPSIKRLIEFLISLDVGKVKVTDNTDESTDLQLKELIPD